MSAVAAHWSGRWIGLEWRAGEYECGDFVSQVLAAEFGLDIDLPRGATIRERDRLVARLATVLARRLEGEAPGRGEAPGHGEAPRDGDAVLMRARGRRSELAGHHIGLWCAPCGEPSVLHCMAGAGACLHPLAGLAARGLEVDGIWRWLEREETYDLARG